MKNVIELNQISKKFGDFEAVRSVSLSIREGECFGLLGPNGAGKSTLIGMIYAATSITAGELRVFGLDPQTKSRELKRHLGVVTQEDCLDESMNVFENMTIFSHFVGLANEGRSERIMELLEFMSLDHKKDSSIKALSGGMKQRLVFVRALLNRPKLLILDEPTTGLDPAVRHLLWDKINQLKKQGVSLLLTTHYMDEAERLCDRVAVMDQGQVVALGSPKALIAEHTPGYVASFEDLDFESRIQSEIVTDQSLELFKDASGLNLRAPDLEKLILISKKLNREPRLIRPSNLEDVFLKVSGRELSANA